MLLYWGTLVPQGRSCLASVRFAGPVRVRAIRIHPNGALVFTQNPEAISETEPESFSLSIFLTAQTVPTVHDSKPKGSNVLVPTQLSYSGGFKEFPLDMGPEFTTRLMVIQGNFMSITLSVYGDVIRSQPLDISSYEPMQLPGVPRYPLPAMLNLGNMEDPSLLARSLLALIPDSPPLPLIIRLVCCLKDNDENSAMFPTEEDSAYADLTGPDWLEKASDILTVPVSRDVNLDALRKFVEKTSEAFSDKTSDCLHLMAGLLRYVAAQPPVVVLTMLDTLDVRDIVEAELLDKDILGRLEDAAANHSIAHCFRKTSILTILQSLGDDSTKVSIHVLVTNLIQRILGWERFEKSLTSSTSDVSSVARWIKEIASDDMTFGIFLLSMIEDESLASKFRDHPLQDNPVLPMALWRSKAPVSVPEFAAFTRAFLGVSCVMVVLCWSIHISHTPCVDRILAMIRLWQEADGYREIVNQVVFVPQLTYHLEGVLRNGSVRSPSASLIHVEQILSSLISQPETMIRPELAVLLNALSDLPATISEDERSEMMDISMIAEGGLSEAVTSLVKWSNESFVPAGSRSLQAALLILEMELENRENGEWRVIKSAWQAGLYGIVYCLVEIFHKYVAEIRGQYALEPPPPLEPSGLLRLVASSNSILRILTRLLPGYPLPGRPNRDLTRDIASLFVATDALDSRYPPWSAVCQAARTTRPACAEAIAVLSSIPDQLDTDKVNGVLVLQTLFHTALYPEGDDPIIRLEQVFWLLDLVLPLSLSETSGDNTQRRFWTRNVLPNVLPELRRFMRALTVDHQVQLVKRLADLDRGEAALGHWFVDEELKYLITIMQNLNSFQGDPERRAIMQFQVSHSFQLLHRLFETSGISEVCQSKEIIEDISHVLSCTLEDGMTIHSAIDFACILEPLVSHMDSKTQLDFAIILLRDASSRPFLWSHVADVLAHIRQTRANDVTRVADEFGPALQHAIEDETYWVQDGSEIVSLFRWFVSQSGVERLTLPGISHTSFARILEKIATIAPDDEKLLSNVRDMFVASDDVVMRPRVDEPGMFLLSPDRLGQLLSMSPTTPSTPHLSGESIFKMATLSPITALAGSSKISTLTKTYQNNDFRQLSVRQNTSRRPSMHVDDFEHGSTTLMSPTMVQPPPLIASDYTPLLPSQEPENE